MSSSATTTINNSQPEGSFKKLCIWTRLQHSRTRPFCNKRAKCSNFLNRHRKKFSSQKRRAKFRKWSKRRQRMKMSKNCLRRSSASAWPLVRVRLNEIWTRFWQISSKWCSKNSRLIKWIILHRMSLKCLKIHQWSRTRVKNFWRHCIKTIPFSCLLMRVWLWILSCPLNCKSYLLITLKSTRKISEIVKTKTSKVIINMKMPWTVRGRVDQTGVHTIDHF